MAFGWLEQIGSGIKRDIKRIPGALEQLGDGIDDVQPQPQPRRPITGGFAGNEGVPTFDGNFSRPGRYRGDAGGEFEIRELGQSRQAQSAQPPAISPARPQIPPATRPRVVETKQPQNHPPLTGFDQGTGQMVQSPYSPAGRPQPIASRVVPPMVEGGNPMRHARMTPTEEMPIPGLPNRGGPVPYSDYDAARYSKVMEGAKRSPDGVLLGKDEGGGFKRSWKNSLQNALLGASRAIQSNPQGGLGALAGGALGGGLGAWANPQAGIEQAFDAGPGAAMLEDQARRDTQMDRQRKQTMGDLQIENIESQIGSRQSQAEIARFKAQRDAAVAESTIKLNRARTEAATRGTPVKVDLYNPEKDVIESVQVYPDGRREVLGISGDAMIKGATLESQNRRDELNRSSREREGALNRGSREYTAQLPSRSRADGAGGDGIPTEARQEYGRIQRLKQKADAAWAKAKNPGTGDAVVLAHIAEAAQEDYNANAASFAETYGDYYESGNQGSQTPGDPGWAYIKPRPGATRPNASGGQSAPRATVAPDFIKRVMEQLGVDRATALQRIQNSGIQVQ